MGNQKGRRLKQQQSQEKSEKRRRKKLTLKQKKSQNTEHFSGQSKYAKKKRAQAQGNYSKNSPFTPVNDRTPKQNKAIERRPLSIARPHSKTKEDTHNRILLTRAFNSASMIGKIHGLQGHKPFYFPRPPENAKNVPALLKAEKVGEKWTLSRCFKTTNDNGNSWTEQKLSTHSFKDELDFIKLLSKWQFIAKSIDKKNGDVTSTLRTNYTLVGDFGYLEDRSYQPS